MSMRRVFAPKRAERHSSHYLASRYLAWRNWGAALCALSIAAAPLIAAAQTPPPPPKQPEYEANVKALAGVFGALHSLGGTCGREGDQTWRLNMQSLLDREGQPGAPLRVGMINAFNDGYQDEQRRYPTCSAGARAELKNMGARGGQISRRLAQQNY